MAGEIGAEELQVAVQIVVELSARGRQGKPAAA
jgi:hypothetical protein